MLRPTAKQSVPNDESAVPNVFDLPKDLASARLFGKASQIRQSNNGKLNNGTCDSNIRQNYTVWSGRDSHLSDQTNLDDRMGEGEMDKIGRSIIQDHPHQKNGTIREKKEETHETPIDNIRYNNNRSAPFLLTADHITCTCN